MSKTALTDQQKRKLAAELLRRKQQQQGTALSFSQQRLWFLQQLEPNSPAYNIFAAIAIQGNLEQAILEQTLKAMVERHASLRTIITEKQGQAKPHQQW